MAEGKKREFTRTAAVKAVLDMLDRINMVNSGLADYPYVTKIQRAVLFGSLVNAPDIDKVHDADIAIFYDLATIEEEEKRFNFEHPELVKKTGAAPDAVHLSQEILLERYIRGNSHILSVHSNRTDGEGIEWAVVNDEYIQLYENGYRCKNAVKYVRELAKPKTVPPKKMAFAKDVMKAIRSYLYEKDETYARVILYFEDNDGDNQDLTFTFGKPTDTTPDLYRDSPAGFDDGEEGDTIAMSDLLAGDETLVQDVTWRYLNGRPWDGRSLSEIRAEKAKKQKTDNSEV